MRTSLLVTAAALVAVAAPLLPTAGAAVPPAASGVTVCHFPKKPFAYATPNARYPFGFLLSTGRQNTTNRKVRRAVSSVQAVLQRIGIRDSEGRQIVVDGSYGPQTASAVRQFQIRKGLVVDGKVGQQTWKRLSRSCWLFH